MSVLIAFTLAGVMTFLLRISMVVAGDRIRSSASLESAIALVSPAVLTAIVASAVLTDHGRLAMPEPAGLAAVAAGAAAVHRWGNVSLALAVGLPVYWVVSLVGLA